MTIEQITNPKKEVRVLRSTYYTNSGKDSLIGKILEVRTEWYEDNTVGLINEDGEIRVFNRSDVQFLVPEVMYEGQRIGIGDTIKAGLISSSIVYGYQWYDGQWKLNIVIDNDFSSKCILRGISDIKSHTPLYKETKTLTRQEIADKFGIALEELKIEG